jgi:hypothetical protein
MENNKSITAVEWLVEQFFSTKRELSVEEIIEQAKQIEKQQIIDAVTFGQNNYTIRISVDLEIAEQYYNETFQTNVC